MRSVPIIMTLVPGNQGQSGTEITMGQGNTGVIWNSNERRNPWHDLEGYPGIGKLFCLFAAQSEQAGIPRAGADQVNDPVRFHPGIAYERMSWAAMRTLTCHFFKFS